MTINHAKRLADNGFSLHERHDVDGTWHLWVEKAGKYGAGMAITKDLQEECPFDRETLLASVVNILGEMAFGEYRDHVPPITSDGESVQ